MHELEPHRGWCLASIWQYGKTYTKPTFIEIYWYNIPNKGNVTFIGNIYLNLAGNCENNYVCQQIRVLSFSSIASCLILGLWYSKYIRGRRIPYLGQNLLKKGPCGHDGIGSSFCIWWWYCPLIEGTICLPLVNSKPQNIIII